MTSFTERVCALPSGHIFFLRLFLHPGFPLALLLRVDHARLCERPMLRRVGHHEYHLLFGMKYVWVLYRQGWELQSRLQWDYLFPLHPQGPHLKASIFPAPYSLFPSPLC